MNSELYNNLPPSEAGPSSFSQGSSGEAAPARPRVVSVDNVRNSSRTDRPRVRSLPDNPTPSRTRVTPRGLKVSAAVLLTLSPAACAEAQTDPQPAPPAVVDVQTVLPQELPDAVAQQVGAVVDIGQETQFERVVDEEGEELYSSAIEMSRATGVRISEDEILTAGHVGDMTDIDQPFPCGDFTVAGRDAAGNLVSAPVLREAHIYRRNADPDSFDYNDLGIMRVDPALLGDIPIAEISDNPSAVGDPAFFVNYQPESSTGEDRDPRTSGPYASPAILGGIVVDATRKLPILATDLDASYGEIPDDYTVPGGSGGPAFDEEGEVTGVLSMGRDNNQVLRPERAFNVKLTAYPDRTIATAQIQPATQPLLDELRAAIADAPACEKTEPTVVQTGEN